MTAIVGAALGTPLLGCAANNVGSLDAGAALPRATYQVLGKTKYDQTWIDKTIEGEVKGFGFKRPLKRPASFDAAPAQHKVIVTPATKPILLSPTQPTVITVVPTKKTLQQRINDLNEKVKRLEGR